MKTIKEINVPDSWKFDEIIREALQHIGDRKKQFTEHGVSKKIYIEPVAVPCDVDNKILATYADVVTIVFPDAAIMTNPQNPGDYNLSTVLLLNVTAWGNMAYIAEHAIKQENRIKAKTFLSTWRALTEDIIK